MNRECASLLPRVCEVLADSAVSLPDDTSLEKLLDWFTGLTKNGESLLDSCPCLLEFIPRVVYNTSLDPGVLSFALKLTGLLAATEDSFKMLQECSALDLAFSLQHWRDAGLWDDPCIRIGWIQGLRSMLQHPLALSFFVQSDLTQPLLQLQTDTSLFIASAANQVLAHILVHFQPLLGTECDSINKTDNHEKRTSPTITAIPKDTIVEYNAVVIVISEYLKESLIPDVNTQHHRSVQLLRLLALLLTQARPALQNTLLQNVGDTLKQLVTTGCSQLMLPLMDVILAAQSTEADNPNMSFLLSSMLNTNKPADLIHAATAYLRRGLYDREHAAWAAGMVLLPLDIITGQSLLDTNSEAHKHRFSTTEQLKSKTSCITLICLCLTNTPCITLMPAEVLRCTPGLIVSAVLTILSICSGYTSSSSLSAAAEASATGFTKVYRNIIGSSKVQKCALEALTTFSHCTGAEEKMTDVFTVMLQYLDNPDSDPTVLHKSYQTLIQWMSACANPYAIKDPKRLRQDLIRVVRKRVCDMRWEVRDSTVEFLGKAVGVLESCEEVGGMPWEPLISISCAAPLLKEALQDTESYIRASAISALAQTDVYSWQQGEALTQQQTETVSQLLEILSQDTEGFARRAVIQYFTSWFLCRSTQSPPSSSSSLLMNSVRSVLSLGSADLDWEVKVHTLELAGLLLDEAFLPLRGYKKRPDTPPVLLHPYGVSEQTYTLHTHSGTHSETEESDLSGVLNNLVELGVVSAVMSGLVDCDRPVALKACRLLIRLRDTVCPVSQGPLNATATMATVSCELPDWGWGQEIKKILKIKTDDWAKKSLAAKGAVDEHDSEQGRSEGGRSVCADLCEVLRCLDLDERLEVLSQSSDHVHNSPLSLLQDILTASTAHTDPDNQTQQEVIVDCY